MVENLNTIPPQTLGYAIRTRCLTQAQETRFVAAISAVFPDYGHKITFRGVVDGQEIYVSFIGDIGTNRAEIRGKISGILGMIEQNL